MIILDMTKKSNILVVNENAFNLETGILTIEIDSGNYDLSGKTITATFNQRAIETAALSVINGIINLPITPNLIVPGYNEFQLNFYINGSREQSPIFIWRVLKSIIGTDESQEYQDILANLLDQLENLINDDTPSTSNVYSSTKVEELLGASNVSMIQLINKTGVSSVKGTLVSASQTTDLAFGIQTSEYDTIGVVAEDGKADGESTLLAVHGIADVLLKDGTASTRGYWVKADAIDGRANATQALPAGGTIAAIDDHFKEIGHCLESKASGVNVLCKVMLHFN